MRLTIPRGCPLMENLDDRAIGEIAEFCAAFAVPMRLKILNALRHGEHNVSDLTARFECSQANVSKHLAVLRGAGLVRVRTDAQRRWYSLHSTPLRDVDAWLMPYRRHWADALDALEEHLDEQEQR